ncbi:MAG: serine hydrolase domain-containing protein [Silvibacterium sp.]
MKIVAVCALLCLPVLAAGQQGNQPTAASKVDGIWLGTLHAGPQTLRIQVHLQAGVAGAPSCVLDSIGQKAFGIPCGNVVVSGDAVSFDVPPVSGKWSGHLSADGKTLTGTWTQGSPLPLVMQKQTTAIESPKAGSAPGAAAKVDGIWLGALHAGPQTLWIQVHLNAGSAQSCVLDSIDQKAFGIPCTNVVVNGNAVSFDVPPVSGKWSGTLSEDRKTLTGTWTQGRPLPLVLEWQRTAREPPAPRFDAMMPAVKIEDLEAVLDRDLAEELKSGELAPATDGGVTIGVVSHGVQRVFSYGTAKPDSVFEIGSITKTFTGLLLAQMVQQRVVKLDEPVRGLLPPGTVAKPSGAEITLLDLSDQHSGLPRMPDNFHPADRDNPYADYDAKLLYQFIGKQGVALPANAPFGYSNVGVGLLGQALADRAGMSYADLLSEQITGPLGMHDTGIALTAEMKARFIEGHDGDHRAAHAWDLDALAGAGGIRSTAADMLTYLEAQLHPESLPLSVSASAQGKTLPAAIAACHVIHAKVGSGMSIALNWFREDETGNYWHNGATGGYSAYAMFNPEKNFAVIVLSNTTLGPNGSFADKLGLHIFQRLTGMQAMSLAP